MLAIMVLCARVCWLCTSVLVVHVHVLTAMGVMPWGLHGLPASALLSRVKVVQYPKVYHDSYYDHL